MIYLFPKKICLVIYIYTHLCYVLNFFSFGYLFVFNDLFQNEKNQITIFNDSYFV